MATGTGIERDRMVELNFVFTGRGGHRSFVQSRQETVAIEDFLGLVFGGRVLAGLFVFFGHESVLGAEGLLERIVIGRPVDLYGEHDGPKAPLELPRQKIPKDRGHHVGIVPVRPASEGGEDQVRAPVPPEHGERPIDSVAHSFPQSDLLEVVASFVGPDGRRLRDARHAGGGLVAFLLELEGVGGADGDDGAGAVVVQELADDGVPSDDGDQRGKDCAGRWTAPVFVFAVHVVEVVRPAFELAQACVEHGGATQAFLLRDCATGEF
mmetsp:Transcript_30622/g.70102  ORF Transcript_30622/g.70102 Transcript_30622/m.70102 type:complete len:267 (+) Transcript_30622:493-1293(+)